MKSWLTSTPKIENLSQRHIDANNGIMLGISMLICMKLGNFLYYDAKKLLHITSEYLEITLVLMSIILFVIASICAFKMIRLTIKWISTKDNTVYHRNPKDTNKDK